MVVLVLGVNRVGADKSNLIFGIRMYHPNLGPIGFCFLFISNFLAETYYVKATGNNTTGLDEANAFTTVNNARNAASDGDTIIIVGTITQTGQVIIDKSLNFQHYLIHKLYLSMTLVYRFPFRVALEE